MKMKRRQFLTTTTTVALAFPFIGRVLGANVKLDIGVVGVAGRGAGNLKGVSGEKGLHLCFGNYGGQSIQEGFWKNIMNFLNALNVDHLVLEFARRGYDELEAFKELRDDIALGLGVIDIKDNVVETPDTVAKRIENAVSVLGADRIKWIHPDCGFWMLPRTVADAKMAALVEGRNQLLGA